MYFGHKPQLESGLLALLLWMSLFSGPTLLGKNCEKKINEKNYYFFSAEENIGFLIFAQYYFEPCFNDVI